MRPMLSVLLRRDVLAWCLYDWANSAYVTSIMAVLLPVFYQGLFPTDNSATLSVFGLTWHTSGQALWAYSSGLYMLVAAVAAPVLGAMADSARGKKWFLAGCVAVGAIFTIALAGVGPYQFVLCSVLYMISGLAWTAANIFYDGFLPELGRNHRHMEAISSAGYALGYVGGGLVLAGTMLLVGQADSLGITPLWAVRISFIVVGLWWAGFTIPMLLAVRERNGQLCPPGVGFIRDGFARVRRTLAKVGRLPTLARFLVAFLLYNSGIGTIIVVAAAYGKAELNLSTDTIVMAMLMVNIVGAPATFGFLWLANRLGPRNSIVVGILVYIGVVLYATQVQSPQEFWLLAFLIALVQGGTQAISRSMFGSMIPRGLSAEFYGFFSVYDKVGTFIGPLLFGLFRDLTGDSRSAMMYLLGFFVAGLALLLTTRIDRGIEQAHHFALELEAAENRRQYLLSPLGKNACQ